jgi:hypothetical protein
VTEFSADACDAAIFAALEKRGADKSICPSEIARKLAPADWRQLMEPVRARAYALRDAGRLRVTQGDAEIEKGQAARGAVRLRLPR